MGGRYFFIHFLGGGFPIASGLIVVDSAFSVLRSIVEIAKIKIYKTDCLVIIF
jgi:hypothetical protein